jgi:hypothetical protein
VASEKSLRILSATPVYWKFLPIDSRNHITVLQTQFAGYGIGLYAGIGYYGELTVFEGQSDGCGFQQLI